ncbi:hypothetical protein E4U41_002421, partial [Claviceps citrina]
HVAHAIDLEGSRPPGLLIVGRACTALLDQRHDERNGHSEHSAPWVVEEGFRGLDPDAETATDGLALRAAMMEGV